MQIFPFEHTEEFQPNDLESFKSELKKITVEKWDHERARTKFYGALNKKGFLIQPKLKYQNFWRPLILGTFDYEAKTVHVKLAVHKRSFIILGVWLGAVLIGILTSDAENKNFFGSLSILLITVFWYLSGLIFYNIDVRKTIEAIDSLKSIAADTVPK